MRGTSPTSVLTETISAVIALSGWVYLNRGVISRTGRLRLRHSPKYKRTDQHNGDGERNDASVHKTIHLP